MPQIANIDTDATPTFTHDCKACVFVGAGNDGRPFDAYICPGDQMSVIRRRSDRVEDYGSFPMFIAKTIDVYLDVVKAAAYVIERFDGGSMGRANHVDPDVRRALLSPLVIENGWTLAEYIAWHNRPEEGIIKGELMEAGDWAELGIIKASELGEYLDACVAHEMRKEAY